MRWYTDLCKLAMRIQKKKKSLSMHVYYKSFPDKAKFCLFFMVFQSETVEAPNRTKYQLLLVCCVERANQTVAFASSGRVWQQLCANENSSFQVFTILRQVLWILSSLRLNVVSGTLPVLIPPKSNAEKWKIMLWMQLFGRHHSLLNPSQFNKHRATLHLLW